MSSFLNGDLPANTVALYELQRSQEPKWGSNLFYKCRLCLKRSGQGTSIPPWSRISSSSERVHFVTKIPVRDGDGFPAFICDQCSFELSLAEMFIQRSVASDNVLRSEMTCATNTTQPSSTLSRNRQLAGVAHALLLDSEVSHYIKEEPEVGFENELVAESNFSSLNQVKTESEQTEDISSMPKKCRLCLGRSDQVAPISSFAESIAFVAKLTIQDDDGLPAFVCGQCTFELSLADGFIRRCIANDNALHSAVALTAIGQESAAADPLHLGLEEVVDFKEEPDGFYERVKLEFEEDLDRDPLLIEHAPSPTGSSASFAVQQSVAAYQEKFELSDDSQEIENNARSNKQGSISSTPGFEARKERKQKTKFTCNICNTSFKFVTYYNLHLRTHTAEERLTAERLDNVNRPLVQVKNVAASKSKLFSCATCGKSFVRKGNLLNHAKSHIAELSSHSSESGEKIFKPIDKNVDAGSHTENQSCCKCGIEFADKHLLACHYTSFHTEIDLLSLDDLVENLEKRHKCCKCRVEFHDKYLLACHYTAFHTEREMFLDFMEETTSQSTIHSHIERNDNSVLYGADMKDMSDMTYLAETRNSNGCGTNNTVKSSFGAALKGSIIKHKPVRLHFTCDICKASFKSKEKLFLHIERYVNKKPHPCKICQESFESNEQLASHEKLVSCKAVFDCIKCHKSYQKKFSLNKHFLEVHYPDSGKKRQRGRYIGTKCDDSHVVSTGLKRHILKNQGKEMKRCNGLTDLKPKPNELSFDCVLCGLSIIGLDFLTSHLVIHGNESLNCSLCVRTFSTMESFINHMIEIHQKVRICICEGNCLANVYKDISDECIKHGVGKTEFVCAICNDCFSSERYLMKHNSYAHTDQGVRKPHKCRTCGSRFRIRQGMLNHEAEHYSCKGDLVCRICQVSFRNRNRCNVHMRRGNYAVHSKPFDVAPKKRTRKNVSRKSKDLCCSICSETFASSLFLKNHLLLKHNCLGECICCKCGGIYSNLSSLTRHFLSCLGPGKNLECVMCGLQLFSLNHLKDHLTDHGKKELHCKKCAVTFATLDTFITHIIDTHYKFGQCVFCKICGFAFTNSTILSQHLALCLKKKLGEYFCDMCGKYFPSRKSLLKHIYKTPDENEAVNMPINCTKIQRQCVECGFNIHSKEIFLSHMAVHGKKALNCMKCARNFSNMTDYMQHMTTRHYHIREFVCEKCGRDYNRIYAMKMHLKFCQGKTLPCHICGVNQRNIHQLSLHLFRHGNTELECNNCKFTFANAGTFLTHMFYTHYKFGQCAVCDICAKVFECPKSLNQHRKKCQFKIKQKHVCGICNKSCLTQYGLDVHARIHVSNNSRYLTKRVKKCSKCGTHRINPSKDVCFKCTVRTRTRKRTKGQPKVCNLCLKSFVTSQGLKLHIISVHTDPIPYHCDICGRTRATKKEMKHHIRRHMTVFRLKCDFDNCNKTFRGIYFKNVHMLHHTGERPFICDICNKGCTTKVNLKLHINEVHLNLKFFQCNACELRFRTETKLLLHLKSHL